MKKKSEKHQNKFTKIHKKFICKISKFPYNKTITFIIRKLKQIFYVIYYLDAINLVKISKLQEIGLTTVLLKMTKEVLSLLLMEQVQTKFWAEQLPLISEN